MDKFGPEILVIQFGFLVILSTLFLWLWFSNRRKYHNLKHAIPANVVKSYLDSIIQNSTSLKSQLFRGGGLDSSSVPSVMPLNNLTGGEGIAVSGAPSTALLEELNQKKAQIAALDSQLSSLQGSRQEVESKLTQSQGHLNSAQTKIKELEALLAERRESAASSSSNSNDSSGDSGALQAELAMVTKERDDLRDRLKEFEIIADDLANLKRLQQENEQLKRSLSAQGGELPSATPAATAPVGINQAEVSDLFENLGQSDSSTDENTALEEFLAESSENESAESEEIEAPVEESSTEEPQVSASEENPEDEDKPKSEKTPEDLLSEFEKMLG